MNSVNSEFEIGQIGGWQRSNAASGSERTGST
jgi:hypothetical protein